MKELTQRRKLLPQPAKDRCFDYEQRRRGRGRRFTILQGSGSRPAIIEGSPGMKNTEVDQSKREEVGPGVLVCWLDSLPIQLR